MPQIAQISATWLSQLFWLLLTFGAVYLVVGRGMVPRVQGTIDQRDASVAADLKAAEDARAQADAQEERWRLEENSARAAAQHTVAEARAQATAESERTLGAAGQANEAKIAEAEARIAAASAAAVGEIENVATDAAQDIVARLSGAAVPADATRQAVKAALHG